MGACFAVSVLLIVDFVPEAAYKRKAMNSGPTSNKVIGAMETEYKPPIKI
jgi:hypothetical protein